MLVVAAAVLVVMAAVLVVMAVILVVTAVLVTIIVRSSCENVLGLEWMF